MKLFEKNQSPSRRTGLASLLGIGGGRSRLGLSRRELFGMSGTFGRGLIRHCDTWEIGSDNPENATVRRDVQNIAERRRREATERLGGEKKRGFYDFLVR